jgi:CPA2 family monovalent cation:H+ antiporter-2
MIKAMLAFGVAVLLARLLVGPLFDAIAPQPQRGSVHRDGVARGARCGWATGAIGLSLTLGAFLGGMIVAETPFRAIIQAEIKLPRALSRVFLHLRRAVARPRHADAPLAVGDRSRHAADHGQDRHERGGESRLWLVGPRLRPTRLLAGAGIATNVATSLAFGWLVPGSAQLGFLLAQGSEFASSSSVCLRCGHSSARRSPQY